jgi:hypothetical protein
MTAICISFFPVVRFFSDCKLAKLERTADFRKDAQQLRDVEHQVILCFMKI